MAPKLPEKGGGRFRASERGPIVLFETHQDSLLELLSLLRIEDRLDVLALCLLLGQLGAILRLEEWLLDLSPFAHVPKLPDGEVSAEPLVWLVAAAFVAAGLAALRHCDVR